MVLIIAFSLAMFLAGAVIMIQPADLLKYLGKQTTHIGVYIAAIVVRLLMGFLLISRADQAKFPLIVELIGWVFLLSSVVLAVIQHGQFIRLLSWVLIRFSPYARFAGFLAGVFGGFLLYAFL